MERVLTLSVYGLMHKCSTLLQDHSPQRSNKHTVFGICHHICPGHMVFRSTVPAIQACTYISLCVNCTWRHFYTCSHFGNEDPTYKQDILKEMNARSEDKFKPHFMQEKTFCPVKGERDRVKSAYELGGSLVAHQAGA